MQYKFIWLICLTLMLGACSKELGELNEPQLEVTVDKTTFKVNEPVVFTFSGNQNNISFYSGEVFNDYAFKDGRTIDLTGQGATLDFFSQLSGTGTQAGQVTVWLSNNYNGKGDLPSVKAATWTEVTSSFKLATAATNVASGKLDVSTRVSKEQPLYIGFKYITKPQAVNGLARVWWIQSLAVRSKAEFLGTKELLLTDQESSGFRTINQYPADAPSLTTITATRVTLAGNKYKDPLDSIYNPAYSIYDPKSAIYDPKSPDYKPTAKVPVFVPYDPNSPYNDPETETWVISKPVFEDKVNLGPDKAVSIKGINLDVLDNYSYTYKTPGTYKVYFVATNHNIDGVKTVVRQLDLTITP
ncbi:DUF5017 domain-containing protein [Chitinophaga barathri]|uniref:DUF5017 domain-containing protein n=1 Tax=Chitinophaga barathri TaxID=1647451 RepID=A0A3N4MBH2_9BACT|nr:DUF5017 domain-containing protein [Chitinophaga barathri]RPD39126.1 DUF5017 domain-containing protein [Chitinophaga barathri]